MCCRSWGSWCMRRCISRRGDGGKGETSHGQTTQAAQAGASGATKEAACPQRAISGSQYRRSGLRAWRERSTLARSTRRRRSQSRHRADRATLGGTLRCPVGAGRSRAWRPLADIRRLAARAGSHPQPRVATSRRIGASGRSLGARDWRGAEPPTGRFVTRETSVRPAARRVRQSSSARDSRQ